MFKFRGGHWISRAGVKGSYQQPIVGVGNQTRFFCEINKLLRHFSAPDFTVFAFFFY